MLNLSDKVPGVNNEKEDARHIEMLIQHLDTCLSNFKDDLVLFDTTTQMIVRDDAPIQTFSPWLRIAARDGAMNIYNFSEAIAAIRQRAYEHPTLNKLVDRQALKEAAKDFQQKFRSLDKLRHGIAHSAEMVRTKQELKGNAMTGVYDGPGIAFVGADIYASQNLENRTFTTMHQGHMRSYDISDETLKKLEAIRDKLISAFQDLTSDGDQIEPPVD